MLLWSPLPIALHPDRSEGPLTRLRVQHQHVIAGPEKFLQVFRVGDSLNERGDLCRGQPSRQDHLKDQVAKARESSVWPTHGAHRPPTQKHTFLFI